MQRTRGLADSQAQHYPFSKQAKMAIDGILLDKKTLARKRPTPTTDDVIAALTFGFWTNFFRTLSPVDAPEIVPKIFPFHQIQNPKKWGSSVNRHELGSHLQMANMFRNRVAHHEPLFKFSYQGAYPQKLSDGLSNLSNCMDYCLSISNWINERAGLALRQSNWFKHFEVLSKLDCFDQWILSGQQPAYRYFVQARVCAIVPCQNAPNYAQVLTSKKTSIEIISFAPPLNYETLAFALGFLLLWLCNW